MSLTAKINNLVKGATATRRIILPDDIREHTRFIPRPLQQRMQDEMRRFNSWVVHRRFGKTVLAVNTIIERAVECPFDQGRYAYAGPTYSQVEDLAWTYLKDYTAKIPGVVVQESKLAVWIPTRRGGKARIRLYGTDTPKQRLRGIYLDGVVFDEWAQIPPSVWQQQVRPMLSDAERAGVDDYGNPNQWAIFIFTPHGRNHAYRMHQRATLWAKGLGAKVGDSLVDGAVEGRMEFRHDWSAQLWKSSETGVLSKEELRLAKMDAESPEEFEQEFECSFDAAVKGAIFAKQLAEAKENNRFLSIGYNPMLPVHTGWDLGMDDCTAIWFCQVVGHEVRMIDYYEASGAGLDHYADVLEKKGYRYGRHYLPHDVEVVELGTNKSRKSVLSAMGVRAVTVPRHGVEDGIAAVRAFIPRCYWDEANCAEGLDRLALYRRDFDDRQMVFRQKPKHDWTSHGADALRTLAMGIRKFAPDNNETQFARAELG